MTYTQIAYLHLATVLPAAVLGVPLLAGKKGDTRHRLLGKIYLSLMAITAFVTFFMSAEVGPALFGHFGGIHILSAIVLGQVWGAYVAARNHNIRLHKRLMLMVYFGGIVIAGSFAFLPGRMLYKVFFA